MEKFVYQHAAGKNDIARDVIRFESAGFAAYQLLVGVIIAIFFETYDDLAFVVIAPFFIRAFALSVFSKHVNEETRSVSNRVMRSLAPIIGVFVGFLLIINKTQLFLVFSAAIGFLLYIIIRDMIPSGKQGKPTYFALGALITVITFMILDLNQTI